jgi:hypothetical protein
VVFLRKLIALGLILALLFALGCTIPGVGKVEITPDNNTPTGNGSNTNINNENGNTQGNQQGATDNTNTQQDNNAPATNTPTPEETNIIAQGMFYSIESSKGMTLSFAECQANKGLTDSTVVYVDYRNDSDKEIIIHLKVLFGTTNAKQESTIEYFIPAKQTKRVSQSLTGCYDQAELKLYDGYTEKLLYTLEVSSPQ